MIQPAYHSEGYTERYGLIYTDLRNQKRTIKDSGVLVRSSRCFQPAGRLRMLIERRAAKAIAAAITVYPFVGDTSMWIVLHPAREAVPEKLKLPFKAGNEPHTAVSKVLDGAVKGREPLIGEPPENPTELSHTRKVELSGSRPRRYL